MLVSLRLRIQLTTAFLRRHGLKMKFAYVLQGFSSTLVSTRRAAGRSTGAVTAGVPRCNFFKIDMTALASGILFGPTGFTGSGGDGEAERRCLSAFNNSREEDPPADDDTTGGGVDERA